MKGASMRYHPRIKCEDNVMLDLNELATIEGVTL